MKIETIYRAYIEASQNKKDPELEDAMDKILNKMEAAGMDIMQAEAQINAMLDRQEEVAFQAGFCEALDLCCQVAAMVQK